MASVAANKRTLNQQPTNEKLVSCYDPMNQVHWLNCPIFLEVFLKPLTQYLLEFNESYNKPVHSLKDAPRSYDILCGNLNVLLHFYLSFQVQLLHFLVAVSYPNEGAGLWLLLSTTIPFHLLFFFLPSTAHKIHTWRGTKEPKNEVNYDITPNF